MILSAVIVFGVFDDGIGDEAHGGEAEEVRLAVGVPAVARGREERRLGGHELHVVDFDVAAGDGVAAGEVDRGVGVALVVGSLDVAEGDVADEHCRGVVMALRGVAVELVDHDRVLHVDDGDRVERHMLDDSGTSLLITRGCQLCV
jgi:hypothetical protein